MRAVVLPEITTGDLANTLEILERERVARCAQGAGLLSDLQFNVVYQARNKRPKIPWEDLINIWETSLNWGPIAISTLRDRYNRTISEWKRGNRKFPKCS